MQHSVHIMLGQHSEGMLTAFRQYITQYSEGREAAYFKALLLLTENRDDWEVFQVDSLESSKDVFIPGLEDQFEQELRLLYAIKGEQRDSYIRDLFTNLFTSMVNIKDPGQGDLHVCFYLPAYDLDLWKNVRVIVQNINELPLHFKIDIILFAADTAHLFDESGELAVKKDEYCTIQKETIKQILEEKASCNALSNLIVIQNINRNGVALNLDQDMLVRILGEYALLVVNNYHEIFNVSARSQEKPITAMGISMISLDKYYYVQYLLHKSYVHILNRERVGQEEVDVNKVSGIVQKILKDNTNIFSAIYSEFVEAQLDKKSQEEIIEEVTPIIEEKIQTLISQYKDTIVDGDLSLPEKKAALAQLLGEDDELLAGYQFNKSQLTLDDCETETLNLFIEANNALLEMAMSSNATDDEKGLVRYAVLSAETREPAANPLPELKKLSISIKSSTNYIRQKTKELNALGDNIRERKESDKRLTDEGFYYEGRLYRLLPTDKPEKPLEETYIPTAGVTIPSSIDLRPSCTPVKDQGQMGACGPFAVTAAYEYILNKNKQKECDLSERFLYYNVRKANNEIGMDNGSNFYDLFTSLSKEGICQEEFFPYNDKDLTTPPVDEAYIDALKRKVLKAKNVERNLDHIRSAISEGYPVIVSVNLFDSFGSTGGFITHPKPDEERYGKHGRHAMLICGYSDEDKFFIVRNSWGSSFGDKGYCYMPYSYLGDNNLLNMACIITEVSVDVKVDGTADKIVVSFDKTNSEIREAILINLINDENITLARTHQAYSALRIKYETLRQTLGNNSNREQLQEGSLLRLSKEVMNLKNKESRLRSERMDKLDATKKGRTLSIIIAVSVILAVSLGYGLALYFGDPATILTSEWTFISFAICIVDVIILTLWLALWKHNYKKLDRELKEEIEDVSQEAELISRRITVTRMKMHMAGMVVDKQSTMQNTLKSKYYAMKSYVGNLRVWHKEEIERTKKVPELSRMPFISLLSNEILDSYFDSNKDRLTEGIKLSEMFKTQYNNSDDSIIRFKNNFKQSIVNELFKSLDGFSIYDYATENQSYDYLSSNCDTMSEMMSQMDLRSHVFISDYCKADDSQRSFLFVEAKQLEKQQEIQDTCNNNFTNPPLLANINSPFKLILFKVDSLAVENIAILR